MKLGIIGLPQAGKCTVFEALTRILSDTAHHGEARIGTIRVPDERVDRLSDLYQPRKTTYAQVEYYLPGLSAAQREKGKEHSIWTQVRDCDALIHVIRNFSGFGFEAAAPLRDFQALNQELILTDLVAVSKRIERLELDRKRGKAIDQEEWSLLEACQAHLEAETPLRHEDELANAPLLRGFALLSAKPMLVLFNNEDDNLEPPQLDTATARENCMVMRGKLEHELAQMSQAEAREFLTEFGMEASAMDRVIHRSYAVLGLISFFTVGEDEVKAWTIKTGTVAQDAAEVIHSDMKKGFIRAEVLPFADLMAAGSYAEARKRGTVRLEGKGYPVQDGDIIHYRFNV